MVFKRLSYLVCLGSLFFSACSGEGNNEETSKEVKETILHTQQEYAPDKRVVLFDVKAYESDGKVELRGETTDTTALYALLEELDKKQISYADHVEVLPSSALEEKTEAIVQLSVANLRSKPSHSSELVTQATLGTPVKVFKKKDNWYYVQTPDDYLAWVDSGGISLKSPEELNAWRGTDKVIFLEPYGFSFSKPDPQSQRVSDLVAGNILERKGEENGYYRVSYPNSKTAYIKKSETMPYKEWLETLDPTGENLSETARMFMGVPYLWGGTSPKGVDCSGFTKTVFFLNGMVLPRDASQQIAAGEEVDSTRNFEKLETGDLLYFGKKATDTTPEKIIHVGMWIGDNKFIHSMGEVRISTFDTTSADFDQYNYDRYLRTKRVLGRNDKKIIQLEQSHLFMAPESTPVKD